MKDKAIVKPQDLAMWYNCLLGQVYTQEPVWVWAREDWEWIKSALGGDMSFDRFVIYPANNFKTQIRLEEYRAFFEPKSDDMAISRNIKMGINEIRARVQLIESGKTAVSQVLKAY